MHEKGAPVFVKVDEYNEVLDVIDMIKSKIKDVRNTLGNIDKLRADEDSEVAMWNGRIDDIEKKIEEMDKLMFQPDQSW
jgi:tetrahydromethanopterin S-methyltransferase subunit G